MKAIKLILLFTVILGCIIGFFFLTGGRDNEDLYINDANQIQKYSNDCKKAWQRNQDWNKETFLKYHELASQLENKQLKDLNTAEAIKITKSKIFAEWQSNTCNHDTVQKYLDAIKTIKSKDSNAQNNGTVKNIEEVDSVYQKAYKFVNNTKQFEIYPSLRGSNYEYSWTNFSDHSKVKKILKQKDEIKANSNYIEHLSNIEEIKTGLDDIPNKLEKSKEKYYNKLAEKLVKEFKEIPKEERIRIQLNNLGDAQTTIEEENNGTAPEELSKFYTEFETDVENNEYKAYENSYDYWYY